MTLGALVLAALSACGGGGGASEPETSTDQPTAQALALPSRQAAVSDASPALADRSTGTGSATLSWEPPLTGADGAPVAALLGYHVYYGKASGQYSGSVFVASNAPATATVSGLDAGTWYFTVTAVDAAGNESNVGHELSKSL
jgi:hypothetical protein